MGYLFGSGSVHGSYEPSDTPALGNTTFLKAFPK